MALRIVFAGTPEFAATHLRALLESPHEIIAVLTQPDRPAGRGQHLTASPVKNLALAHHLPVLQPLSLKDEAIQTELKTLAADVFIIVAYGLILPKAVLAIPRFGCINVHASLLPAWRGAAPIQRAIEAGDTETGITIMQMDEGLDTGAILLQSHCEIEANQSSANLFESLARLGAHTLITTLDLLEKKQLIAKAQQHDKATYAHKIQKTEALLDWSLSAEVLVNKVRAFNPWPVAYCQLNDQTYRIWRAQLLEKTSAGTPGQIIKISAEGIDVQCNPGSLRILELQAPGKKSQAVADFVNAHKLG